jgi:hypothetical protein
VKKLVMRLLAVLGLAPARLVASQAREIAEVKAGSLAWKTKASAAMERAKSLEGEVKRQAQLVHRLTVSGEKLRQRQDEVERLLNVRLADAEQALNLAREYLMAIDVKLDILEGAANVLDTRTRTVAKQHSGIRASV